jgi:voltage-gated potassium channel
MRRLNRPEFSRSMTRQRLFPLLKLMWSPDARQVYLLLAILVGFTTFGASGFRLTEGWDWLQCVYEAVIIMTTVGLSATRDTELQPITKIFIITYLMLGIGLFSYTFTLIGQRLLGLQLHGLWEKRRMQHQLDRVRDHYIICGYGRMGQAIGDYLHARNRPFVVIDHSQDRVERVRDTPGALFLVGDATDDELLKRAGIERARSLATVLPTDADNVYVVLSARLLNERLQIIARASDEKAVDKMERAGASRVVSPFSSGAVKMARFMLNPSIEDFLEVTDHQGSQLELADVLIGAHSPLVGRRLMDTDLREKGVMVIGIRRSNGERLMPPPGTAVIEAGDSLFVFGAISAVNGMVAAVAEPMEK